MDAVIRGKKIMYQDVIEYRIKTPGLSWENTPIVETRTIQTSDFNHAWEKITRAANRYGLRLMKLHNAEVRWNRAGYGQGHYMEFWQYPIIHAPAKFN